MNGWYWAELIGRTLAVAGALGLVALLAARAYDRRQ